MTLRNLFGKTNSEKDAAGRSPLLQAMKEEIPYWPPQQRRLMERIVIEAEAAGVTSMDQFFAFLESHPDLRAGYYAVMSGALGSQGQQMVSALQEEPMPVANLDKVRIASEEIDLSSPENMAVYYAEHPEESIEVNSILLENVRTRGDRLGEAVVLGELGLAHARLNQLGKAIYYFNLHLQIARELGNWQWEMQDYRNLGRAHWELGEDDRAGSIYSEAMNLARRRDDQEWDIEFSLCLAGVCERQGRSEQAATLIRHASALRAARTT